MNEPSIIKLHHPMEHRRNIFFSVGEPSGDLHAAKLMESLSAFDPTLTFRGFGGPRMRDANCQIDFELTNLAVLGFVEVIPKLRQFFHVADIGSSVFAAEAPASVRPDAVVLVDFPGFNWHIAKRAQQHGIPVLYYLPPQLWAWGSWRIQKMKRYVDHVLCALPFEYDWYCQRGVSAEYVGHPFFDEVKDRKLDPQWSAQWRDYEACQVAVLPGSRSREVRHIWPMQLAAIRELSNRYGRTRFIVACLKESHRAWCQQQLKVSDQRLNLHFFVDKTSEVIEAADCALMKSGSVSLEMMARGTPAVVVYHASRTFYAIGRRLTNLQSMTLPNIVAKKTIMPEFLAIGSTATAIEQSIAAMDRLIGDRDERKRQRAELLQLSKSCAQPGASRRAARSIIARLPQSVIGVETSLENVQPGRSRQAA